MIISIASGFIRSWDCCEFDDLYSVINREERSFRAVLVSLDLQSGFVRGHIGGGFFDENE